MKRYVLFFGLAAVVLAACGHHYTPTPAGTSAAPMAVLHHTAAAVGSNTIGEDFPQILGTIDDLKFGVVGGFTQTQRSQVMAFKPGTVIMITNLSTTTPHTLNVLSTKFFPKSPTLLTTPSGGPLQAGYRSGVINPGKSVTVTLSKAGLYFIGCAFHYHNIPSMRDVLKVFVSATPGPQATPTP